MLKEELELWRDGEIAFRDEMDNIKLGIHRYHDLQELPASQRARADAELAAEHNAYLDASAARFAALDVEGELNLDALLEQLWFEEPQWVKDARNGLKKIGDSISNTAKKVVSAVDNGLRNVRQNLDSGWKKFGGWVNKGVDVLKKEAKKLGENICKGAVRICVGACKTAQKVVTAAGDVTEWAGNAVDNFAEIATLIEFKKIEFVAFAGRKIGLGLQVEYRFGLDRDKSWKRYSYELSVSPFGSDGKFDMAKLAKSIWEKISADALKGKKF